MSGSISNNGNAANIEKSLPAVRQQPKEPFEADGKDRIFALFAFVMGFFFIRWVFFSWRGWGVSVFTLVYCAAVIAYLVNKGFRISRESTFWLAAVAATGISYSLYSNNGLEPWRNLFMLCSAVYLVISATGRQIDGHTSNWILLDGINGMFVIPFKNFGCQYKSIPTRKYIRKGMGGHMLSIVEGILLALLIAGIILPLLMQADSGGFSRIAKGIYEYFNWIQTQFLDIILQVVLAVPVAAYLFGLVAGCAHNRGCSAFGRESLEEHAQAARLMAPATVYTVLGLICSLYIVFIGSQLPYFFSAFAGQRPEGWQVYSEYARSGFFELCRIAAINLTLLVATNLLYKKPQVENKVMKAFNCLLSLLTLVLIATAFSKMALYIGAYGLSIRRLLPCLFMVFLAVVFGGVIALQRWQFSIMRLSATIGVAMLCILCLLNPDGFVARYNAERYLSGTLNSFDVQILYQSGPAGVEPALRVYGSTGDAKLKAQLKDYIVEQRQRSNRVSGKAQDSLQSLLVRNRTSGFVQ